MTHAPPPKYRMTLRPKKSLGQNFLRDENTARKVAQCVNPSQADTLLEIGAGEGALTRHLVGAVARLIIVDVDRRAVEVLHTRFAAEQLDIIHGDVLSLDLASLVSPRTGTLRVVGNIPYNLTTPILFFLLEHRQYVSDATLMMQKEVARRLVATPGSKDYGILAVTFRVFADIQLAFDVSRHVFHPKPEVESSVVCITLLKSPRYHLEEERFFRTFVRSVFGKRRKMLRGSLKYLCAVEHCEMPVAFDLTRRPEDLSVAELVDLSNHMARARR
jgi:16S rRNA (adenine1518-N6/adenine1519-N6)-dimethyltransferase